MTTAGGPYADDGPYADGPYAADLALALRLAGRADTLTLSRFRARDLRVRGKPDRTPVTDADLAVEDVLRRALAAARPADAFAGEEGGGEAGPGRTWLVDPVDGTKNFLRGVPVWATLIALLEDGVPVLGVVGAPALRRRWWAVRGGGAWLSEDGAPPRRLRVSRVTELAEAYLSTTRVDTWRVFGRARSYAALAAACWEDRGFGDFLQHCLVAEGVLDLAAEPAVAPWDIAAVQIVVEEAGGRCTDLDGGDPQHGTGAVSANPVLHARALSTLAAAHPPHH